ncbi:MAG: hypothetical protein FWF75_07120 [Propionibacteriaceae bacterium]|nr:hypothetical protein [Propionibacteriaceae bacterium]
MSERPGAADRARRLAIRLSGGHGVVAAVVAWLVVLAVVAAGGLVGGIGLLAALVVAAWAVASLVIARTPSHWTRWGLVASAAVVVVAFAYVWWVSGVMIAADDDRTTVPSAATHGGIGLIALLLGGVGIVAFAIISVRTRWVRSEYHPGHRPGGVGQRS